MNLNQTNTISFILADDGGAEVTGIGSTFSLQIRKAGGSFAVGQGTKAEIGFGWYQYVTTAGECDTVGELLIVVTHAGVQQQNLVYTVVDPADVPSAVVTALLQYAIVSGKTVQQAWLDIWAVTVGKSSADNSNIPTQITYALPDGSTIQVTHILTDTTRDVT